MKKSLLKKLTRMARDGDPEAIEALAEAVEEIVENPSGAPETVVIAAETAAEAPEEPAAETEETPTGTADSDVLSAILERLDQLIALLTPASPAADGEPDPLAEQVAEIVEEAVEAAETAGASPEDAAALVEEIADPAASAVLEQESDADGDEDGPLCRETGDALRAALQAVRPALKRMSRSERVRACADIAARLKKAGMDSGAYAGLMAAGYRRPANPADLGKQIMASRNPNYK